MSGASDLVAHLRPCLIDVVFDGAVYTLPALDATEWLCLVEGDRVDLYDIFPILAGQEAIEHVEDALWEGRVTIDDVAKIALAAFGAAADRPWWVANSIIQAAKAAWDIVHVHTTPHMSLAGWLDLVWAKMMAHVDPKKRAAFVNDIEKTPKGWEAEVNFDDEGRNFLAAMNAVMK